MNAGSSELSRRSRKVSAGHLGDKRTENKMKTKKINSAEPSQGRQRTKGQKTKLETIDQQD